MSLVFTVNGTSFADIVNDSSFETSLEPVYFTWEDLDRITHARLVRWKGGLKFTVNPTNVARVKAFMDAVKTAPCTIVYHSNQANADVSQTMMPDANTIKTGFNNYDHAFDVSFTEC